MSIRAFFSAKKCSKVRSYFSVKKKIFLSKSSDLWEGYDPDSWPKNLQQTFIKQNLQILCKTFGKARRGAQSKLIFFVEGLLSELRKKAQNSDFDWDPLHGEIGLLKEQIFVFNFWLKSHGSNIWRVQLVPFLCQKLRNIWYYDYIIIYGHI